jgi:putative ABC transport system permease protein
MLHTALKSLLAHKLRLLTTALAITLGVALMSGTLVLTDTMRQTFNNLFSDVYRGTDAVVRAKAAFEGPQGTGEQRGRVDASLVPTVRAVPGVKYAQGSVFGYARIIGSNGTALGDPASGAPTFGTAWTDIKALNPFTLAAGSPPRKPDEVVIDQKSADDGHLGVGDVTTILVIGPPLRVRISGIARFGSADSAGGASSVLFTPSVAQRLLAEPGKFDTINLVADPGVSQDELVRRVSAVLPSGVEAVTGAAVTKENQTQIQKGLSFFSTFLLIFAVVALLVGAFMMFNTFAITVSQRTRENGLLRALGASRRQVLASVLLEAFVVGVIASVVGLGLGIVVAIGLKNLMSALGIDIPSQGVTVQASSLVVALVVGVVVTLFAAVSPARKAAKVSPIAAMQLGVAGSTGYGSKQRIFVGLGVLAAGIAALFVGLFANVGSPVQLVGAGVLLVFFGVSILGRTIALPLSRAIGSPLPRTRGITGELARENAMRNPKRTAASASALMIGVGVVAFITVFASSTRASISHSINTGFSGDIVIDTGGGIFGGVDPALARRLNALPEVGVAAGIRQGLAKVAGSAVVVQAGDPASLLKIMDIKPKTGTVAGLDANSIGVYKSVADDKHWTVGSTVPVLFAKTGQQMMRIAVIYGDNTQVGNYFMSLRAFEPNFAAQFDHEVFVESAAGVSTADALTAIHSVTRDYPGVKVLDRGQYVDEQMTVVNRLLALVYVLLALAIVIALMGIGNTLALSISERVREIGLLRAVGMTRSQLRSTIRWESVIIALQGTVLGLLIGVFFGWALVSALSDQGFTQFSVPLVTLVVVVVLACVAGMLAAVPPSRRAARLDVLRAVVSE